MRLSRQPGGGQAGQSGAVSYPGAGLRARSSNRQSETPVSGTAAKGKLRCGSLLCNVSTEVCCWRDGAKARCVPVVGWPQGGPHASQGGGGTPVSESYP